MDKIRGVVVCTVPFQLERFHYVTVPEKGVLVVQKLKRIYKRLKCQL